MLFVARGLCGAHDRQGGGAGLRLHETRVFLAYRQQPPVFTPPEFSPIGCRPLATRSNGPVG